MTKIMYILNYPGDGGTEKYVLNLIAALGKNRCVFVYSENGPFLDKFKELGLPTYQVTMNGPFDLKAAKKIKEICQQEGVQYIHAQFLRENYISLLAKLMGAKVKVVWTYHVNVPMPALFKMLNTFMIRLNHRVISVANFIKMELLQKGIPEDKITVIYNGIKVPKVVTSKRANSNEKIISVVGRLSEEKGHKFLFKSLAKLKHTHPHLNWKLNIVGDGPLKDELNLLADKLNLRANINFQGFVNNMDTVYINSDLIVLPSENEAFPFVAIEALAYEKPVISTNVGGLPEIIRQNETGLLVPYGDENAMADSILKVLEDDDFAESIAAGGKDFFLKNLTFDKMLNQTLAIYNLKNEDNK
ncbi:glycosyltransferase family 4 protein [Neobacillus niacini]|uniref:glycosyltransferase family 4 protein n=1 Tax=Neobacillus niacini TaxID=86668 RepID=UPI00398351C6